MTERDLTAAAVFNNAVWCDAVCQALGCDTDFADDLWINSGTSPPFYPNAISLTRAGHDDQFGRIRQMVQGGLPEGWTAKDAYLTLDLALFGFRVLFEAEWISRSPDQVRPVSGLANVGWDAVTTEAGLASWESAWHRAHAKSDAGDAPARVFMPELLDDPDIVLLAAHGQGRILGLVVANRSDDGSGPVVGLSNLVLPDEEREAYRAGAVAAVISTFPDLPLVGYEQGAELDAMVGLRFDRLGPLRVWTND